MVRYMRICRDIKVAERLGCSRATVWRKAKTDPDFPQPVKFSPGITGWIEAEVDAYLERKVAEARERATP